MTTAVQTKTTATLPATDNPKFDPKQTSSDTRSPSEYLTDQGYTPAEIRVMTSNNPNKGLDFWQAQLSPKTACESNQRYSQVRPGDSNAVKTAKENAFIEYHEAYNYDMNGSNPITRPVVEGITACHTVVNTFAALKANHPDWTNDQILIATRNIDAQDGDNDAGRTELVNVVNYTAPTIKP